MTTFQKATVWITGASAGIGRAYAVEAASRGANVVLSARTAAALEETRTLCDRPDDHLVLPFDVTDEVAYGPAVASVLERYGVIDVLINNSGMTQRSKAIDTELAVYRRLMAVNYFGTVGLTLSVLPHMLERGRGHLAVTSSVVGKFGSPLRTGYSAAKHAVHGFMDSLRAEVHDQGIRVTTICPGFVATEISKRALTGDGSNYGKVDPSQAAGVTPAQCATRALDAISSEKDEVYIGGREKYAVYLKRLAPRLLHRILRKAAVT